MITTEVHEPNKRNLYNRSVYYRNSNGLILRHALIDDKNNVVRDYLYEHNADQLLTCIVLLAQDHIAISRVKKFFYYENSTRIKSTVELKCDSGHEVIVQKTEHHYDDTARNCKVTYFGETETPVGYSIYGYREGDQFMSLLGSFNMDNEKVSWFDLGLDKFF
jgi:hypothetical protein